MEERRGFDRLVYLSDAVVAIAATLLVLPLVELTSELSPATSTADLLQEHRDKLLAFVLSFVVISRIWMVHHALFARLRSYDGLLVVLNFGWLLAIVFLPFPTELIGTRGHDTTAEAIYVGTLAAATLLMAAMAWRAKLVDVLRLDPGTPADPVSGATAAAMVLALLLVVFAGTGLWALLLLLGAEVVDAVLARRRCSRRAGPPIGGPDAPPRPPRTVAGRAMCGRARGRRLWP